MRLVKYCEVSASARRFRSHGVVIAGLLLVSAFGLLCSVEAQCTQWDVSGKWTLKVEDGPSEKLLLIQDGNDIRGESIFYGFKDKAPVKGTIKGEDFEVSIDWDVPGSTFAPGVFPLEAFIGKIGAEGVIHGHGSTISKKDLGATGKNPWSSDRPMKCVEGAILTVPGIIASRNDATVARGKSFGTTTITRDAGRTYPYAEVWVKVDDEDKTSVAKSNKGTLVDVAVVPGKTYIYTLESRGKVLATLTVKFHRGPKPE